MSVKSEAADSAFQLIGLDGAVDAIVDSRGSSGANSPVPTEPEDEPQVGEGAVPTIIVDAPAAGAALTAAAPAADAVPATDPMDVEEAAPAISNYHSFVCMDASENRAGIPFGVVPNAALVAGGVSPAGNKYYAIARGRFIGVFDDSSMYTMAINKVSNPICWCPQTLSGAVTWFNIKRNMGLCEIVV
ncbi:hypothetical protein BD626DRAFT_575730 [Schizophyllum amplum]|uniref:Uncharacterized protein n=1 Tax=Schizophyllum amplum TaxID=97359 RepID=A0A550BV35_9AGAR|nr:hypothetical protein BD626DRAFT_575730 [Auriculariopsis ampla]